MPVRRRNLLTISLLTLLGLLLTHSVWLRAAGDFLVEAEPPRKAEAAIVLAGDPRGNRIFTAGALVERGYVPIVLVSGQALSWYGLNEAKLAIDYAVAKGYNRDVFAAVTVDAYSTKEEALALLPEVKQRGLTDILLVTSNFHTRRSGEVFRSTFPKNIRLTVIAAPDPFFEPATWWHQREGKKIFFFEACKTIAGWVGL